jgi:hypothetical protein
MMSIQNLMYFCQFLRLFNWKRDGQNDERSSLMDSVVESPQEFDSELKKYNVNQHLA